MKDRINLLPAALRREQLLRKRLFQWGVALFGVLVAGWTLLGVETREYQALAQRLNVLSREHQPTQTMLKQLVSMREQLDQLHSQEIVVRELERQRSALALLAAVSQTASATGGRLQVTKLEVSNFQSGERRGTPGAAGKPAGNVLLSGLSLDNPAVAELLEGLQDSGLFSRVELLTLKERETTGGTMREYEVRCEFD